MIARPVRIVCTDKGQHGLLALASLVPVAPHNGRVSEEVRRRGFQADQGKLTTKEPIGSTLENVWGERLNTTVNVRAPVRITAKGAVVVPKCPKCGRDPGGISAERLAEVSRAFTPDASGSVVLDISRPLK